MTVASKTTEVSNPSSVFPWSQSSGSSMAMLQSSGSLPSLSPQSQPSCCRYTGVWKVPWSILWQNGTSMLQRNTNTWQGRGKIKSIRDLWIFLQEQVTQLCRGLPANMETELLIAAYVKKILLLFIWFSLGLRCHTAGIAKEEAPIFTALPTRICSSSAVCNRQWEVRTLSGKQGFVLISGKSDTRS